MIDIGDRFVSTVPHQWNGVRCVEVVALFPGETGRPRFGHPREPRALIRNVDTGRTTTVTQRRLLTPSAYAALPQGAK